MAQAGQCWGHRENTLWHLSAHFFLGGEDPVTEAGAGHPCEAKPICPAKGLLENKKISMGQ